MTEPTQLSRSDLAAMSPAETYAARREGRLAELAAGRDPGKAAPSDYPEGQLTPDDLKTLTPEEIVKAHRAGLLEEMKRRDRGYRDY